MFCIDTTAKAKKCARSLEKFLAKSGTDLVHGHALNAIAVMAGFVDWNAMLDGFKQGEQRSAPGNEPSIFDIDFDQVESVEVYDSRYSVVPDTLTLRVLREGTPEERDELDADEEVLELVSLNDDVYSDTTLTVAELLDFKWNAEIRCFVNSAGHRFQALIVKPYEFSAAKQDEPLGAEVPQSEVGGANTEPNRYQVYVYCGQSFVGRHECIAPNKATAEEDALDVLWDDRVERYEARVFSEALDDDEGGGFSIFMNDQLQDEDESFTRAYCKAKQLAERNPHSVVEIQNVTENSIVKFNQ